MSEWNDDVYAVTACMAPGLFEPLEIYDSSEEAHKHLPEIAELVQENKVFFTYSGEAIMTDKILFIRVTRV